MGKKLSLNTMARKNRKKNRHYLYLFISIFAIAVFFIIISNKYFFEDFFLKSQDTVKSFSLKKELTYKIEGDKVFAGNLGVVNGNIAVLSDKYFETVSPYGKKIDCRPHNFSNPVMKSCGNRALIYDEGGTSYGLQVCSKSVFEGELECKIICGDIVKNGTYGFVTESSTYLSRMVIFDHNKNERYRYNFADFYISGISIRSDGKAAAVCGVSTSNGGINSCIYIFDFAKKEPLQIYEIKDNMLISVNYLFNKNLIAVGDSAAVFIDKKAKEFKEVNYKGKRLNCIDINKYMGAFYCLSSEGVWDESTLVFIDRNGIVKIDATIHNRLDKILYDNNRIIGVENKRLLIYDILGKLKKENTFSEIINGIFKISCDDVRILGNKTIKKIDVY